MPILALFGALLSAWLIYRFSVSGVYGLQTSRLLLTGIVMNVGYQAAILFATMRLNKNPFSFVQLWSAGTIFGDEWRYIVVLAPAVIILGSLLISRAGTLNVMALGNETAAGLGLNLKKAPGQILFFGVSLAVFCVSLGGVLSFVGMIAPHMARRLVGGDHKYSIPAGIMVSLLGAPYFAWLLHKKS